MGSEFRSKENLFVGAAAQKVNVAEKTLKNITFYCHGRKTGNTNGCPFKIYAKFDVKTRKYKVEKFNDSHRYWWKGYYY